MPRIYFGHPVNAIGTTLEEESLDTIRRWFPDHEIDHPGEHVDNYFEWRDEKDGVTGMDYYFQEVLPDVDIGVFLPFEDGTYGAGMADEARFLADQDCPVYEMDYEGNIYEITVDEIEALTIEETKDRIY